MKRLSKLWQKISIISALALLFVVTVCSTLITVHARERILASTVEQARIQQYDLATSFLEMAIYYLGNESDPVVRESGVRYIFTIFADETAVLTHGARTLHSSVSIRPEEELASKFYTDAYGNKIWGTNEKKSVDILDILGYEDMQYPENIYRHMKIDGRQFLIVGGTVSVLEDTYGVFIVKDITEVYNSITAMIWRFVIICAAGIVVGSVLISLLVRRAVKPLTTLTNMTKRIADGEYDEQMSYKGFDEVSKLAANFNIMTRAIKKHIAQLEDTAQRQQLFIGGLTHELKTPMAAMMLHTDTLLTADLTTEEANKSLRHLYEQCRWLERLSQRLLKLLTLGEKIEVQPVKVQELFDDVHESTAEMLRKRNTPLVSECEIEALDMDYDLMKSLLINLVDNASKASKVGGEIRLRAYCHKDNTYAGGTFYTLEVSDCGAGIPKEEIERVTDVFFMVDRSRSKKLEGSGLGLALVKSIADAHKATLKIESELGAGTSVKVTFCKAK